MIGIGIITYNRPDQFLKIVNSVDKNTVDFICAIKDGGKEPYPYDDPCEFYEFAENRGVSTCKNYLIDLLIKKGASDIFLLEDDVLVHKNDVWQYCRKFSKETGLLHFNWNNYRDKFNHVQGMFRTHKALISATVEASFSYFHKKFLEKIRFDENYVNAWEHIDVEYQGARLGFLPPFKSFVSPAYLSNYLECIDKDQSTITGKELYEERYIAGYRYWLDKWGIDFKDIPVPSQDQCVNKIKEITRKYAY